MCARFLNELILIKYRLLDISEDPKVFLESKPIGLNNSPEFVTLS